MKTISRSIPFCTTRDLEILKALAAHGAQQAPALGKLTKMEDAILFRRLCRLIRDGHVLLTTPRNRYTQFALSATGLLLVECAEQIERARRLAGLTDLPATPASVSILP